jgi:hypothetical protein
MTATSEVTETPTAQNPDLVFMTADQYLDIRDPEWKRWEDVGLIVYDAAQRQVFIDGGPPARAVSERFMEFEKTKSLNGEAFLAELALRVKPE